MAGRDNAAWNDMLATLDGGANRCARLAPPPLEALVRFVLCSIHIYHRTVSESISDATDPDESLNVPTPM